MDSTKGQLLKSDLYAAGDQWMQILCQRQVLSSSHMQDWTDHVIRFLPESELTALTMNLLASYTDRRKEFL